MNDQSRVRRMVVTSTDITANWVPAQKVSEESFTQHHIQSQRKKLRSASLLALVKALDTEPDEFARKEMLDNITAAYGERGGGVPVGLFAKCYLGAPFVDHVLDLGGFICEHFRASDPVPPQFAGVRVLAGNPAYIYIEVYSDGTFIPVREDGSAAN